MVIALVHNQKFPVAAYGGTERVIWWLAKALREMDHEVLLVAEKGSQCPYATVLSADFTRPIEYQIPGAQLFHFFETPKFVPERPYVVTIGGNGQPGEKFLINTAFVSRNHASRHGAECYVYNGLDPADYRYSERKEKYLLFLAKAAWKVKNVKGAIRFARDHAHELRIVGGSRAFFAHWRGVHWEGMLGGEKKAELIAGAKALIFPVLWNEPFGLAVIEAMASGTPVIASPFGAMPELIPKTVGFLCRQKEEFTEALAEVGKIQSAACRAWVIENFHYQVMARSYLLLYERVLAGETLNARIPETQNTRDDFTLGI